MKLKKFEFFHKGVRRFVNVEEKGRAGKFIGLMFHHRNCPNMLFKFKKDSYISMHSWFVFFPFLSLWLDENKNVVDIKVVMPFTTVILPKTKFTYVLELPFNHPNTEIINILVEGKGLNITENLFR